jgi:hypothetical protein
MRSTRLFARALTAALLLCVPLGLTVLALPRMMQGARTGPALFVTRSAIVGLPFSHEQYRAALDAYAATPSDDGDDLAWKAELSRLAGVPLPVVREEAVDALDHEPGNVRVWTLLCEIESKRSPAAAVSCLDLAFQVGSYDWFTTRRRMTLVAAEWPYLDEKLRDAAVARVLPMWHSNRWINGISLRGVLYSLGTTANGRQMIEAGFGTDATLYRKFLIQLILEELNAS